VSVQPAAVLAALSSQAVSGSVLARNLGVTRAAVWKQIEALRQLGAPIEAVAGRGYRLGWPFEPLDAKVLRAGVDAATRRRLGDLAICWQVDSTSSELLRRAGEGAGDLSICIAEMQSGGRGRRGRAWRSPLCGNVYFSLLRRFTHGMAELSGLSLVAGLAVHAALGDCGVHGAVLKWPNDVLVDQRKLAGVLVELGGEFLGPCFAVIGIGINVRLPANARIDQPHIDLASVCAGQPPSRHRLIAALIRRLVETLDRFSEQGFGGFRADYARCDALAGRPVRVQVGGRVQEGVANGVDARGALRVRHGHEVAVYDSAEVTVRGA
jgi:BirA family transcriptional regulator, biotin operon repressor / biotin---[acetyl-CoA-carboxylase] ligase